jgi:glutamate receptor 3
MDEYWNNQVLEFGAINITGFRVLQTNTHEFRQFAKTWRNLDAQRWPGAATNFISVRKDFLSCFLSDITQFLEFSNKLKSEFKADTALMFDGTRVILDAYNRLLKKKADIFRNNFRRGEFYNNGSKGIDCKKLAIIAWEHGDRISKFIRKVSMIKIF